MSGHVSAASIRMRISDSEPRDDADGSKRSLAFWLLLAAAASGFVGSVLIALASPLLVDGGTTSWWYAVSFPFGVNGNRAGEYLGMALMCAAWLVLGYVTRSSTIATRREMLVIAVVWVIPLCVAPAVFSRDLYSYLAQGAILHVGLDPYHHGPIVLRHLGYGHLVAAVSPFWWRTPAPYGPLFLGIVSLIVAMTGSQLVVGVIVVRLLALFGIALVAVFGPRLARLMGADPVRAIWLGVMSPLAMFELVLAGHNDALMAGLTVVGVTLALEGRYRSGIALCAVASVIKLPAIVAVVFLTFLWIRSSTTTAQRARAFVESAALCALVIGGVSAATGVGLGWFSSAVLTVPGKVHLAITPVTQFGWTIGPFLRVLGAHVSDRDVAAGFGVAADIALVVFGALLLYRTTRVNVVVNLGVFFLLAAFFGPAAWPWYFIWGLALLACVTRTQRSFAIPGLIVISVFLVKPDGILALPVGSSPIVLVIYLLLAALAISVWRSRTGAGAELGEPGVRPAVVDSR
ncbi:MAG: polyprenol phosphomannose-dependent alpha 1,6 mannosyltransferase MptB [Acidimicrobiales bacterium]